MDTDSKILYQFCTTSFERLKELDSIKPASQQEIENIDKLKEIYKNVLTYSPQILLKKNREYPFFYYFYGKILYYLNKNTRNSELKENSIRLIKNAIERSQYKDSIEFKKDLLDILVSEGKNGEAIQYCSQMLDVYPKERFYIELMINLLIKTKRTEPAIQYYKKLISQNPYEYELYTNCAKLYLSLKDYRNALQYFKNSKELEPKFPDNYKFIGKILLINNQRAMAGSNFKTALARKIYNFEQFEKSMDKYGKGDKRDNEQNTLLFLIDMYSSLIKCGENFLKELQNTGNKAIMKGFITNEKYQNIEKSLSKFLK